MGNELVGLMTGTTVVILLLSYLIPAVIATARHHHQAGAIFALNLFLGWTLLGWVMALVWACTAVQVPQKKAV